VGAFGDPQAGELTRMAAAARHTPQVAVLAQLVEIGRRPPKMGTDLHQFAAVPVP